jgi:hypothetical protein
LRIFKKKSPRPCFPNATDLEMKFLLLTKINFFKKSFNVFIFNYLLLKTYAKFKNLIRKDSREINGQNM